MNLITLFINPLCVDLLSSLISREVGDIFDTEQLIM